MILLIQAAALYAWMCISCLITFMTIPLQLLGVDIDGNVFLARVFRSVATPLTGIEVKVEGAEHLKDGTPRVVVANHQHALDFSIFSWFIPKNMICIGKFEVIFIPFFGILFWALGHVLIHRKNRVQSISGLDQAAEAMLGRSATVFVFPEGTRNKTLHGFLPFKKGAFYLAAKTGVPIVPIVVSSLKPLIPRDRSRIKPGVVYVKILPPISTLGVDYKDKNQVAALLDKTRSTMIEVFDKLQTQVKS